MIGVGESLEPVTRAQHGVARTFLVAGLFALAAAALAGFAVASRVSQPLRRMAGTAATVSAGSISPRIGADGLHGEILVLAEAFDNMLDRLDDAFARQRSFVSDASHELRTPLTVVRGQLEVLARQPDISREDVQRVTRLVGTEIERMERLVDELLALAKTEEGWPLERRDVELRPYLRELFDGLSLSADRRFELGAVSDTTVAIDPDRISQVLHNLTQNAVAHTRPGRARAPVRGGEWAAGRLLRGRRRAGHPARGARPRVRPLPPHRLLARPQRRRQRPRPGHRPRDRGGARGEHQGRGVARGRGAAWSSNCPLEVRMYGSTEVRRKAFRTSVLPYSAPPRPLEGPIHSRVEEALL